MILLSLHFCACDLAIYPMGYIVYYFGKLAHCMYYVSTSTDLLLDCFLCFSGSRFPESAVPTWPPTWPPPASCCSTAEGVTCSLLAATAGITGRGVRLSHSSDEMVTSLTRGLGGGGGRHLRWYCRLTTRWVCTWYFLIYCSVLAKPSWFSFVQILLSTGLVVMIRNQGGFIKFLLWSNS